MNKFTQRILAAFALSTTVAITALFAQSNPRTTTASQTFPSYPSSAPQPPRQQVAAAPAAPVRDTRIAANTTVRSEPAQTVSAPARTTASGPIGSRFDSNLYTVEKTLLTSTQVGENYQYRLRVTALENITKIHVVEHLPEGLEFVSASPDSRLNARDLSWKYPALAKGESLDHIITVKPVREGSFFTSSMVCVDPIVVLPLFAGSPRLEVVKTGPATAELGSPASFTITVRNAGSAPARDVVVTDILPAGLSYTSGERQVVTPVGTLDAGASKVIHVPLTATARGTQINTARATALNLPPVESSTPVTVVQSKIGVTKTGPSSEYVFKNATYHINVTNEGDTTLNNVEVVDELPRGTSVVAGGESRNGRVAWNVPSLAPGQSMGYDLTLTTSTPGAATNTVTARAGNGISDTAQATTVWEGAPGVLTELVDTKDPIKVGESTVYEIRITNQGTLKAVNANLKITLSANLRATSATGDAQGTIEGQVVTFPEVIIPPRGSIKLRIPADALTPGIGKARLEFMSSFLIEPLIKEESTFVY